MHTLAYLLPLSILLYTPPVLSVKETPRKSVDIISVVSGKPITAKDLDVRVKLILVTSHIPATDENIKALREQVLKNMIEEYVQLETAKKFKVLAKDNEVSNTLKQMAKDSNMSLEQLETTLKREGIPIDYLRERVKAQLSWIHFVRGAYAHTMHISDKDIDNYLAKEKENQQKDQYEIYEIFLRADDLSQLPAVEIQAQDLIKRLKSGASFRTLAQNFSNSPTASKGGYIGWVTKTHEGSKAYHDLEPGQASYPVKTNHGYSIYFLSDRKLAGQAATGDLLVSYKQITIPLTPGFKPEDDPYLATHLEEIMSIATSGSAAVTHFEKVAKDRDLKIDTVSDKKLSHFSPEFQNFLKTLSVGKLSMPSLTPEGMVVIMLTQKKAGESQRPLSREEVKEMLESEKLSKIAAQNLSQLMMKAYIKLSNPDEFPNLRYGKTLKGKVGKETTVGSEARNNMTQSSISPKSATSHDSTPTKT